VRTYKFETRTTYALFVMVVPWVVLAGGVAVIVMALSQGDNPGMLVFLGLWWAPMLFGVYRQATMPHTIEVGDDGRIRFVGTFRTTTVPPSNVGSVRGRGSFVTVKHTGGTLLLLQGFAGFHEFLTELRRANPNIEMRGV
jgi:hypothetical protein